MDTKEFIKDIRAKFQDPNSRKVFFDLMVKEIRLSESKKLNRIISMSEAEQILRAEFDSTMKKTIEDNKDI